MCLFISCDRKWAGKPETGTLKSRDALDGLSVHWACCHSTNNVCSQDLRYCNNQESLRCRVESVTRLSVRGQVSKHESSRFLPLWKPLLEGSRKGHSRYLLTAYTVLILKIQLGHVHLYSLWILLSALNIETFRQKTSASVR